MFIQPDWFEVTQPGVGTNRYSYSFNDPINQMDPSGNCEKTKCGDSGPPDDGLRDEDQIEEYYSLGNRAARNGIDVTTEYDPSDVLNVVGDVSGVNGAIDAGQAAMAGDVSGVATGVLEIALGKAKVFKGLVKKFIGDELGSVPGRKQTAASPPSKGTRPAPGTRVKPDGIPDTWRIRPTNSGGGVHYYNPKNPNESVRIMQGNPNSPYQNSQTPYARQRNAAGTYLRQDGSPSTLPKGGLRDPDAHIPIGKFKVR